MPGKRISSLGDRLRQYVERVWDIDPSTLPLADRVLARLVRVLHIVARGFRDDRCALHASALTFYSLMAIIPLLAFSLSVAKGVGAGELVEEKIRGFVPDMIEQMQDLSVTNVFGTSLLPQSTNEVVRAPTNGVQLIESEPVPATNSAPVEAESGVDMPGETGAPMPEGEFHLAQSLEWLIGEIFSKVDNVNFGTLGMFGLLAMLWFVIQSMKKVEHSFNIVWGVQHKRALLRAIIDYMFAMIVLPVLIILSTSLPLVDWVIGFIPDAGGVMGWVRDVLLGSNLTRNLVVLGMTCLTFTFFTMFMPNTRVRFGAGFAGGATTAIGLICLLAFFVKAQIGIARASSVYGSFAVIPIVLLWVNSSWMVILLGAEVAFAVQNQGTYKMERKSSRANVESRLILSLSVIQQAAASMLDGGRTFNVLSYASENRVPVRLIAEIVEELVQSRLLVRVAGDEEIYVLAQPPDRIKVKNVIDVVMKSGAGPIALGFGHLDPRISNVLAESERGVAGSLQDLNMDDLAGEQS